jgi:glutamate dehydrogenase (NAD(P)+)
VIDALRTAGVFDFELTRSETLNAALVRIESGGIDMVLLDLQLPDSSARHTWHRARRLIDRVPIVVMSGIEDVAFASSFTRGHTTTW